MNKFTTESFVSPRMLQIHFSPYFTDDEKAKIKNFAEIFNYKLIELGPALFEIIHEFIQDGQRITKYGWIRKVPKRWTNPFGEDKEYYVLEFHNYKKEFLLNENGSVIRNKKGYLMYKLIHHVENLSYILTSYEEFSKSIEIMKERGKDNIKTVWGIIGLT